jgi:hypothetical protein
VPLGTSIFLVAAGAILRCAATFQTSGLSRPTIGLILILVGSVGVVLSLLGDVAVRRSALGRR